MTKLDKTDELYDERKINVRSNLSIITIIY